LKIDRFRDAAVEGGAGRVFQIAGNRHLVEIVGQLLDVVRKIHETGTTIVLVEQDLSRALAVADTVVCMLEGRVVLTSAAAGLEPRTYSRELIAP